MSDGVYAEMIEIPVSSCEMVVSQKKRKKKNIRKQVIDKTNKSLERENYCDNYCDDCADNYIVKDKKRRFDVISAQIVAVFVLVVAIFITNIFWEDSGINTLIKSVFSTEAIPEADTRNYKSFELNLPTKSVEAVAEDGVITVSGGGAIYSPCSGVVASVVEIDGKYTVTIEHSDVFKTIIRSADFAYYQEGEAVFGEVPVCYSAGGPVQVLMYNENTLLKDYTIADGSFVWQS